MGRLHPTEYLYKNSRLVNGISGSMDFKSRWIGLQVSCLIYQDGLGDGRIFRYRSGGLVGKDTDKSLIVKCSPLSVIPEKAV